MESYPTTAESSKESGDSLTVSRVFPRPVTSPASGTDVRRHATNLLSISASDQRPNSAKEDTLSKEVGLMRRLNVAVNTTAFMILAAFAFLKIM